MARIPDSEIEQLKLRVSMVRLIEAAGIALKPHGKDLVGRCPFHDDKTPSLVISPKANLWHCLGACQMGGSPIDWVMRWHKVSFRHAIELLQKETSALVLGRDALDGRKSSAKPATRQRPGADLAASPHDQALLQEIMGIYHETLLGSPEALAYLDARGIASMELIREFKLGFANRTLAYRLPPMNTKPGAAVRTQLQRVGLLRDSGHEHFTGSLVIPVIDVDGQVTEVYGRKVTRDSSLRRGTPLHLYLPGPHRGVFNRVGIEGSEEVILCEALIDALTLWHAGYRNVTSSYGINGFTDDILAALKTCGAKRVLIAYDRDDAGDRAAASLAPQLQAAGLDVFRILFPEGQDANTYALGNKPAERFLGVVIREAQWLGQGARPALTSLCVNSVHQWVDGEEERLSERDEATPATLAVDITSSDAATAAPSISSLAANPTAIPAESVAIEPLRDAVLAPLRDAALTPTHDASIDVQGDEAVGVFGERRYRVRGLARNLSCEVLKVNIMVSGAAGTLHIDTLDLYQARARAAFVKQAAIELGVAEAVIGCDLNKLLVELVAAQAAAITTTLAPTAAVADTPLSIEQEATALALLRDPHLMTRIVADVEAIGVVGEASNALVGYLACVSRKLDRPLAILIQSTSAAGKSTLMDALLSLMPETERVHYSAMTGQSLFYLGEGDLTHRILAIAEEEGVRQASYALKLLQSQGELTIASTGKDPTTGKLRTEEYTVKGPVMLFLTTTAIDIDEELLNRCLVLTINESREQTAAIQSRQRSRRTLEGLVARVRGDDVQRLHRAAQRLLRPLAVVNPFADRLTFASDRVRMRRDHEKYLALIDAIALLHQYQRPVRTTDGGNGGPAIDYIEVTLDDIALANRLAHEVLGRSLDELPPQTRRVLGVIDALVRERITREAMAREHVRFTRKELRAALGMSEKQVRVHIDRLMELDYVLQHAGRNGQRFVYELAFDGDTDSDAQRMMGLVDLTEANLVGVNANLVGSEGDLVGRSWPARGDLVGTSSPVETPRNASTGAGFSPLVAAVAETGRSGTPVQASPRRSAARHSNGSAAALS